MNTNKFNHQELISTIKKLEGENSELKAFKAKYENVINELNNVHFKAGKSVAEKIVETNSKFQLIIDNIPGYIAYVNANTLVYEFVNVAFQRSFDIPREKIVGSHIKEIIGEQNFRFALKYIEIVKSGKSVSYENFFNLKEGKRWIKVNYVPGFDENEKVSSIIVLSYDITERKQAEESLKESELLLNETGRIAHVGGWKLYIVSQKLVWTKEVFAIHELPENYEPTIEKALEFYEDKSKVIINQVVTEAIKNGSPFAEELEITTARNNKLQVRIVGKVQFDSSGNPEIIYGTFQDITMQKQVELKLNELNADKDRFMAILAHDLKSPFNTLIGFSKLLIDNLPDYSFENIEVILNKIYQTAYKTYDLLEDLLLWTKSQSGKLTINFQKINFSKICDEVINNLKSRADTKGIKIEWFEQGGATLLADENMLKTILRNLISNAIKFTAKNGTIRVYNVNDEGNATIVISDNGIGIEKNSQHKLWDTTKTFTTVGTELEKGSGFGLLLCKEFVEKHGGNIWVESEVGKGSDFKFTIPLWRS